MFDPTWLAAHPDQTLTEFAAYVKLVNRCQEQVRTGEVPDPEQYAATGFDDDDALAYIKDSAAYLRGLLP
jgi:hypothetical protein